MRKILSVLTLIASVSLAHAGPKEDAYEIVEKWDKAITDGDVDAITRLYAPDATMIGTFAKAVMTKPEQIHAYFEVALNNDDKPRTAILNSGEASVIDDTTVVLAGFDTLTITKNGEQIAYKGRVTFVIAKRGSSWQIVHLHRSPLSAS